MSITSEDPFFVEFPEFTRGASQTPQQSCLSFGIECGTGWRPILHNLASTIRETLDILNVKRDTFQFSQIKEKFGMLTIYWYLDSEGVADNVGNVLDKIIHALVGEAEAQSSHSCESCGNYAGTESISGWVITLCSEHLAEYKKQRNIT